MPTAKDGQRDKNSSRSKNVVMAPRTVTELRQFLSDPDPSVSYQPLGSDQSRATITHPHTCSHCDKILVDAEVFTEKALVALENGMYRRETSSFVKLDHSLDEAVSASREGCGLFKWLLDLLLIQLGISSSDTPITSIRFGLVFEVENGIDCGPLIETVDNDERRVILVQHAVQGVPWSRLFVCARQDDWASAIIPTRPAEIDVFSKRSARFSQGCLDTCIRYHEQCRREWLQGDLTHERASLQYQIGEELPSEAIAIADLPTRLIELQEDGNLVATLTEVSKMSMVEKSSVASAGFAALSYCWGQDRQPMQLTSATYQTLRQGVPASSLPATIHDALRFTHSLGLRYMWVDALCIFQDSQTDKKFEIARMGLYYGANTVTLCAASASSSLQGLGTDGTRPVYATGPIQLSCSIGSEIGRIVLYPDLEIREPIVERGWTLQESLLSRRILIFSHQLYWCCVTANAGCEGALSALPKGPNRNFGVPESLVPGIFPAQVYRDYPPFVQWNLGVDNYARRALGFEGDKLLAISAFAAHVHARFLACGGPGKKLDGRLGSPVEYNAALIKYAAGLFLSTDDLGLTTAQLLWRPSKTTNCRRPRAHRAPTWSWASLDGRIKTDDLADPGEFVLSQLDVQLTEPSALYGDVRFASITINGHVRRLSDTLEFPLFIENEAQNRRFQYGVHILPDSKDDVAQIHSVMDADHVLYDSTDLFLLKIRTRPTAGWFSAEGLLLRRAVDTASDTFERVGSFELSRRKGANESEAEQGIEMFFDVAIRTITLI